MESHSALRSLKQATLQDLHHVQEMTNAAQAEQIRLESLQEKDQSQLVPSLYQNVIETLDQFQWLTEEKKPECETQQLRNALAHYFYGFCYHQLGHVSQAVESLSLAAYFFNGLRIDGTYTTIYANTMLLKGLNEKALGNDVALSRYNAAEKSFAEAKLLWEKSYERGVKSAEIDIAQCCLQLALVMTWNGFSAEKAKQTLTVLQEAITQYQALHQKKQIPDEYFLEAMIHINHYLAINYLRTSQYDKALSLLKDQADQAEEAKSPGLTADARLGMGLCYGLQSEGGFFTSESTNALGLAYQHYVYETTNKRSRKECSAVVRIWLQGLSLPEERPEQLTWLMNLIQPRQPSNESSAMEAAAKTALKY